MDGVGRCDLDCLKPSGDERRPELRLGQAPAMQPVQAATTAGVASSMSGPRLLLTLIRRSGEPQRLVTASAAANAPRASPTVHGFGDCVMK